MKELLKQYAAYNVWASQQLLKVVLSVSEERQKQEIHSSFSSLFKTTLHMWDAESIWWQRMKLAERINRPSENYTGSMQDAADGLLNQSKQWEEWISNASDMAIDHVFQYQTLDKNQHKQPIWQMLLHVFNHGTYHRGQLVNMFRQLGIGKVPATDFIVWSRGKK